MVCVLSVRVRLQPAWDHHRHSDGVGAPRLRVSEWAGERVSERVKLAALRVVPAWHTVVWRIVSVAQQGIDVMGQEPV